MSKEMDKADYNPKVLLTVVGTMEFCGILAYNLLSKVSTNCQIQIEAPRLLRVAPDRFKRLLWGLVPISRSGVTRQSDSRQTDSRVRLAAARNILESVWRKPRPRQSYSLHPKTTLLREITRT
ncbi:hypothetical protein PoB_000028500 [Plakobranchus ocellatus]|uniref:Uncharacterized protein n=1 Tax=Plakobranchus ocellatus TaxID=259542 RepID=A0AAV3XTH4_9GAST|nr:hypothetical protein PoB_000028500 [Plakobranchus ocellatus]